MLCRIGSSSGWDRVVHVWSCSRPLHLISRARAVLGGGVGVAGAVPTAVSRSRCRLLRFGRGGKASVLPHERQSKLPGRKNEKYLVQGSPPGSGLGGMAQGHMIIIITIIIFLTLLLPSFWTSRGHRCHPFFPPVLAFNFYRA